MRPCTCSLLHRPRRVVLTGGPGAGKTALLEMARQSFCRHLHVLPETASMLFGGGFPRQGSLAVLRAGQRAIFYTQRELEATVEGLEAAVVLCDRGTIDGVAYWPGPEELWQSVGTTRDEQLARYDAVIHLRTPTIDRGYNHVNHLRIESAPEALAVDERILLAWNGHPRRTVIDATPDFFVKATRALAALSAEFPECCREPTSALPGAPEKDAGVDLPGTGQRLPLG
jgi:predicted ATPase